FFNELPQSNYSSLDLISLEIFLVHASLLISILDNDTLDMIVKFEEEFLKNKINVDYVLKTIYANLAIYYTVLNNFENVNRSWDNYFEKFDVSNPDLETLMIYILHCAQKSAAPTYLYEIRPLKKVLLDYYTPNINFNDIIKIRSFLKRNLSWFSLLLNWNKLTIILN